MSAVKRDGDAAHREQLVELRGWCESEVRTDKEMDRQRGRRTDGNAETEKRGGGAGRDLFRFRVHVVNATRRISIARVLVLAWHGMAWNGMVCLVSHHPILEVDIQQANKRSASFCCWDKRISQHSPKQAYRSTQPVRSPPGLLLTYPGVSVLLLCCGLLALFCQVEAQRRAKKAAQAAADCALRDLSTANKRVSTSEKEKSRRVCKEQLLPVEHVNVLLFFGCVRVESEVLPSAGRETRFLSPKQHPMCSAVNTCRRPAGKRSFRCPPTPCRLCVQPRE